jgi:BatD DUF11 like domain
MVARLIFILCLSPLFLFSGEFTASVNRNQVNVGESFNLNLTLKNGSAQGVPPTGPLSKVFHIHSQQQSNNTSFINGTVSSSTNWKFILSAQREGEIIIPSIDIQTSEGLLSSHPITIKVVKGNTTDSTDSSDASGISLSYDVSNANPFKNEPFVYTIRLTSKKEVSNIQVPKFNIDDAMVEGNGEPKIYSKVVNGMSVGIIEFSYLITSLKPGPLKIPSTVIQGFTPAERKAQRRSFFDDDFDFEPFAFMQGFNRLKPFAVSTEEIVLNVQPPIDGMTPWLPAKLFTIDHNFDESKSWQVGEPFTRVITISAVGLKSNQLPSLIDTQLSDPHFKIYADKPELKDELINGSIKSYRTEQYTIIPQEAGSLTLPEISIPWWDLTKKEKAIASVPAIKIQVMPAPTQPLKFSSEDSTAAGPVNQSKQNDPILYILLAGVTVLLVGAVIWMVALQKKIGRLTMPAQNTKPAQSLPAEKYSPFSDKNEPSSKPSTKGKLNDLNPT